MLDLSWLSGQAHSIHQTFSGIFFAFITVLLLIGIVCEQFKIPFTAGGEVMPLVGRAFIAVVLLYSYTDVTNAIADFTDQLAHRIGDLNNFHLVLSKMGGKLSELTWSWTSVKDSLILIFSFLTFFILYISVFLADAGIVYCWTILYVFSPLLLALFVLPVTSFATKSLYRALIEVSAWKIVWAVLATLLWSSALGHMNDPNSKLTFLTVIAYNLILAISLLFTPIVVHSLASKGITQATSSWIGMGTVATLMSPGVLAKGAAVKAAVGSSGLLNRGIGGLSKSFAPKQIAAKAMRSKAVSPVRPSPEPSPPAWHKDVPAPTQPPPWILRKIEREKQQTQRPE